MLKIIRKMSSLATALDQRGYLVHSDTIDVLISGFKYSKAFTVQEYRDRYVKFGAELSRLFHARWSSESINALLPQVQDVLKRISELALATDVEVLNSIKKINYVLFEMLDVLREPSNGNARAFSRQQVYTTAYFIKLLEDILPAAEPSPIPASNFITKYLNFSNILKDIFWSSWSTQEMKDLGSLHSRVINYIQSMSELSQDELQSRVSSIWEILDGLARVASADADAYAETLESGQITGKKLASIINSFRQSLESPERDDMSYEDAGKSTAPNSSPDVATRPVATETSRVSDSSKFTIYLQEQYNANNQQRIAADGKYGPKTHGAMQSWAQADARFAAPLKPLTQRATYQEVTPQDIISAGQALAAMYAKQNENADVGTKKYTYRISLDNKLYDLPLTLTIEHRGPMYMTILRSVGLLSDNPVLTGNKESMQRLLDLNFKITQQLDAQGHQNMAGHLNIFINELQKEFDKKWTSGQSDAKLLQSIYEDLPNLKRVTEPGRVQAMLNSMAKQYPHQMERITGKRTTVIDENTPIVDLDAWSAAKSTFISHLHDRLPDYLQWRR